MPAFEEVERHLKELCKEWKDVHMLTHTHGQPASPTRLGKEMVFVSRIDEQRRLLKTVPYCSKFGGATGKL